MKTPYLVVPALAAGILLAAAPASALETTVSPSNLNGWVFSGDGAVMGTAAFVVGPGTVPLGTGSVELGVADATQRVLLSTGSHAGVRLDALAALGYSTWQTSATVATSAISLQLDVDYDLTDTTSTAQGFLVFEPSLTGPVTPAAWQTWDALAGKWYMTGTAIVANVPAGQPFPLATPGTLADILTAFPNAGIRATVGSLSLKADGVAGAFTGNADALVFNVTGDDPLTYNFEADSDDDGVPDNEDLCPDSDTRDKVDVGVGPTTINNTVDDHGCTIQDLVNKLQATARNHGRYVSGIAKLANALRKARTITNAQSKEMKTGAAHSSIGKPPTAPAGGTTGNGNNGNGNGNGNNGNGNGNGNNGNGNGNGHNG
jgi:hypothetical protein